MRGSSREAILLFINVHWHQAWISRRMPTVGFGASCDADEQSRAQP
jgi:hypothetical protein